MASRQVVAISGSRRLDVPSWAAHWFPEAVSHGFSWHCVSWSSALMWRFSRCCPSYWTRADRPSSPIT